MSFHDHFSTQSEGYTRFRPHYPRALFEYLASLPAQRQQAWDCGTGNGQAACDLAEFFDEVVATDPSQNQIAHASPHARVSYLVAPAERAPLDDASVDLVTVAQALHWFDLDRFYGEVRRVGKPGSFLAAWSYGLATITPQVDRVVWHLYEDVLGRYWPPERAVIMEGYTTVPFPFEELAPPPFTMTERWSLERLQGYLSTWSSAQAYLRQHDADPLDLVRGTLAAAWGNAGDREVQWPLFVRVGRIA